MEKKTEIIDEAELNAAEREAQTSGSCYVHHFDTPFEFEGVTYEEIRFDFNKLTGADSLAIEAELASFGKPVIAPEFSGEFLLRMAAKASSPRVGADLIKALPISVFNRIRNKARSFLLVSGS